jgi:hypothetical protein
MGNGVGIIFLKKIMKKINIIQAISDFEDRFFPSDEKEFLIEII